MEPAPAETEFLSRALLKEERPVSYRALSRHLNIHVDRAKSLLADFYRAHRDAVCATFVVIGLAQLDNATLIKCCGGEPELDSTVSTHFSTVLTIIVYGLSPKRNADVASPAEVFAVLEQLISNNVQDRHKYYKCGMIQPKVDVTEGQETVTKTVPVRDAKKPAAPVSHAKPASAAKPVIDAGLTSGYVSRKQKAAEQKSTLNFSAKPSNTKRPAAAESGTKHQYKSRKLQALAPQERVVVSVEGKTSEPDILDNAPRLDAKKSRQQAAELEKLFEEEFSALDQEEMAEKAEPIVVEDKVPTADQAGVDTPEHIEKSVHSKSSETALDGFFKKSNNAADQQSLFVSENEDQGARADSVDEDGFITLYKQNPQPSAPAVKRRPAASNLPKGGKTQKKTAPGNAKQSSLLSFFGK